MIENLKKKFKEKIKKTLPFLTYNGDYQKVGQATPIFVTGVGRSGTHFLAEIFKQSNNIQSYHLDDIGNPIADSFWMYAKWYNLSIDFSGFFAGRNYLINEALKNDKQYLESNPYLALQVTDIVDQYPNSKIIITFRQPRNVVLSHYNKGWYENYVPVFSTEKKAPAYQYNIIKPNHFFGRIIPNRKEEFEQWCKLTQVGKISWMWKVINKKILEDIKVLDENNYILLDIDKFDFAKYLNICSFFGINEILNETRFNRIRKNRPGKSLTKKHVDWDRQSEAEFLKEIGELWEEVQEKINYFKD